MKHRTVNPQSKWNLANEKHFLAGAAKKRKTYHDLHRFMASYLWSLQLRHACFTGTNSLNEISRMQIIDYAIDLLKQRKRKEKNV